MYDLCHTNCRHEDDVQGDNINLSFKEEPEKKVTTFQETQCDPKHHVNMMQVHPVVSRLCAPIEGTDAAHLADCLGLDPAKFRQQVNAAAGNAREEAQLAAASVFDDDDRYKVGNHAHCKLGGTLQHLHLWSASDHDCSLSEIAQLFSVPKRQM